MSMVLVRCISSQCYCWLEDTLQTTNWRRKCVAVSNCICVLVCVRLGGTWPYVKARRPSLLVSVWFWWGYGPKFRLNSSLNPLCQCGITFGKSDGNVAFERTVALSCHLHKSRTKENYYVKADRDIWNDKHSLLVKADESQLSVCICIFVGQEECVHVFISKQGTVPLGRHQLCQISYRETFPVTNTESCKTCRWARIRAHLHCTLPFMPWFVMKRSCCCNEFNITLGRIQLNLWKNPPCLWHERSQRQRRIWQVVCLFWW